MNGAKWIWLKGDFEIYHSLLLHSRREDKGCNYPPMWHLDTPYPNVVFKKVFTAEKAGAFRVFAKGNGYAMMDGKIFPTEKEVPFDAGTHKAEIRILCTDGTFPCIYIDHDLLRTDESWYCAHSTPERFPVGCMEEYTSPEDNPHIFKYRYSPLIPKEITPLNDGVLYDFGKETFCRIAVSSEDPTSDYMLYYGESKEEALDEEHCTIRLPLCGKTEYSLHARAFRYLYLKGNTQGIRLSAEYEYLPLKDRADFQCDNPKIKEIWNMCAYTFHLNSREFFLDGIKRDRWVWSGDAYQSHMANNYLYFDNEITKRTILALLGKPPYEQHINTINDYTMYLIISVMEYYLNTADLDFVRFVWKRISALYRFLAEGTDEKDYICARPGDWIFIDWSPMDKNGPLCAEQILYWQTKNAMAYLAELLKEDGTVYKEEATRLKENIEKDFWCEEKSAFIDSYTSGKKNVTRHANIFAILYDFASKKQTESIRKNVLENENITPITTPYFAFFELLVYGKLGDIPRIQEKIESYWGGILEQGATSVWEQFDPTKQGAEHYEMYGQKYGCSLCHAWGSGPLYLLGRYCVGVYPTDAGYKTFRVEPNPGKYKSFRGTVPLPQGEVKVVYENGSITVTAGADGGTLCWKGKEHPLTKGIPFTV